MSDYESEFEEYDELELVDDDDLKPLGVRADQPPGAKTPGLGIKWWQILILLAGLGAVASRMSRGFLIFFAVVVWGFAKVRQQSHRCRQLATVGIDLLCTSRRPVIR